MSKIVLEQLGNFAVVRHVADSIAALLKPERIYLYNQKLNCKGEFTSFKLCVVGDFADKQKAEQTLYWEIDSDLPFDVQLYTPREWEELSEKPNAFARHIKNTGTIVHE